VATETTPVTSDAGTDAAPAAAPEAAVPEAVVPEAAVPEAVVPETDAAPAVGPTEDASPRARAVLVALAALVLVSAVLVGWLGWQAYSAGQDRSTEDEALAAARTATAQVLSYSAPTLDADLARSRSMISGVFAAKFAQLADTVIVPAVKQQNLTTKANVLRAAVIDAQPEQVRALLFVNQSSTMAGAPEPRTAANQVRVTMTKVDGQWLISDLQPL
jgi:Mce-associated membrane protein